MRVTSGAPPLGAGAAGPASPAPADDAKLRGAARQLTGVFAQQLFKAMRATVPQDEGVVSGGGGEEMFTGMLDEHLAGAGPAAGGAGPAAGGGAAAAFTRGLADAVYRRLRAHAGAQPEAVPGAAAGAGVTPPAAAASLPERRPVPRATPAR